MRSFLHQELVTAENSDPDAIAARMWAGEDVYGRDGHAFTIAPASDLPDAMYERPMQWAHLFHPDYAPVFHEDWMSGAQSTALSWLARQAPAGGRCLEIGAWEGASTIAIAHGLAGRAFDVVDTWEGNTDEGADHPSVVAASRRDVYAQFLRNVRAYGLEFDLLPNRMDWRAWVNIYPGPVAFAHLDAAHDAESVTAQLAALLPRLVPGGIICEDDFFAPGVSAPVLEAIPDVQSNGKMWYWRAPA